MDEEDPGTDGRCSRSRDRWIEWLAGGSGQLAVGSTGFDSASPSAAFCQPPTADCQLANFPLPTANRQLPTGYPLPTTPLEHSLQTAFALLGVNEFHSDISN